MLRAFLIICLGATSAHAARKPKTEPTPKVITAAPSEAPTSAQGRFNAAEKSYNDYRYDDAILQLSDLLRDSTFTDGAQRQKARLMLAFSYYITQHEKEASVELDRLFRENSDYPLDRDATHPDMLRFYDSERARYLASLKPVSEPSVASKPIVVAPRPAETIGDRHVWVRIFPAGIGHFLNHDYAGGAAFLSLEAALLATNLTMFGLREGLRADPTHYRAGTQSSVNTYTIVMNVAAFAALALVVIDVIDAFVWSPARGRASLAKSLQADLGPLGTYRVALGLF